MNSRSTLTIAIAAAVVGALGGTVASAQDKYSLKSPSGIAFSDFKGYEDWAVISSARTDDILKVIVGNPTIIKAYKEGVPGNGKPFPDGSQEEHRGAVRGGRSGHVLAEFRDGKG
jgi:hypothetical protein